MITRSLDELNKSVDDNGNLVVENTNPSVTLNDTTGIVGTRLNFDNAFFNIATDNTTDGTYTNYIMRATQDGKAISIGQTGVNSAYGLNTHKDVVSSSTAAYQNGILSQFSPSTSAITFHGINEAASTMDGTSLVNYRGFLSQSPLVIGTGTVQNYSSFYASDNTTFLGSTYTSGFFSGMSAGTNKYGFYADGTAQNFFNGKTIVNERLLLKQPAPTASNATATLTIAQILNRIITTAQTADIVLTLPTGALIDDTLVELVDTNRTNIGYDWNIINTSAFTTTIAAGIGNTVIGNTIVAANTSATMRTVRTAADTYITYRVA